MLVRKGRPQVPERRSVVHGQLRLAGSGLVRSGAEEQYLYAVHGLLLLPGFRNVSGSYYDLQRLRDHDELSGLVADDLPVDGEL
jgi:hypothetical protein